MSGYGMMIPGSKARSNLVSERPTEHGGKEVEHNMIKERLNLQIGLIRRFQKGNGDPLYYASDGNCGHRNGIYR